MTAPLVRILAAVDRGIAMTEKTLLALGVLGMTALSIANVIMRNLFDHSLAFVGELNMALIIMVTFVGIGYAAREARHIRMTALYDQLPANARRWLMLVMSLLTAALLCALAWYAARYAMNTWRIGSVTPALRIPLALIYGFAPAGLLLGGVQYLLTAARNALANEPYISFAHTDGYEDAADDDAVAREI